MKKFLLAVLVFSISSFAQFTEFHPELDWYTIKGTHVEVHYHKEAERTARVIAKIADEVWGPITSLYNYEPETVHYIVKDIDDYSNGATYFFDNKIEIWTSALDFDLRGTHNWLRNVISHEFTHMVQIQASLKTTRSVPAVFLQGMNYEDERRPDILYGFPNFIASYPFAFINVPSWFAEGTAQYMRREFDYDNWDSHRDMILRSYALDGNMLTWNQMGVFDKNSLGNESVYNSGFALTRYIAQKYGEKNLTAINNALGSFFNFSIDAAFKDVLGKDGDEIYNEWKETITSSYKLRTAKVLNNKVEGEKIATEGFGNFYPVYSKDGSKIYYISNKQSDYFAPSAIYCYDLASKEEKMIAFNVRSTFAVLDNGNKVLYAKLSDDNKNWYNIHDLYLYDVNEDEETRLTEGLRANQPSVSPDGSKIVFLFQKDGTSNIGLVDIDGKNFVALTNYKDGEQVYNPAFFNDSKTVVFDFSYHQTRDIMQVNINGSGLKAVIATKTDERNPSFDKDGNLIYAGDETGIFNIYSYNITTGEKKQLTNVVGGAFMPSVADNGDIVYAGYTSNGYKIFHLNKDEQSKVKVGESYERIENPPLDITNPKGDIASFNIDRLKNFNDYELPKNEAKPYSGAFSKITFFPFIRFDNYNTSNKFHEKIKPGVYLSSNDMLNRYSIFAGGSINARLERDLFFSFNYRNKLPLLYSLGLKPELTLDLYSISRKAHTDVMFGIDSTFNPPKPDFIIPVDVTYNLLEVDLAAKHKIFSRNQDIEFRYIFSRYSAELSSFVLPDEDKTLYPVTNDVYLIGNNLQVTYKLDFDSRGVDSDINPVENNLEIRYNYEMNKFNNEGEYTVVDGMLKPKYNHFDFHRLEINSKVGIATFKNHTLTARFKIGTIFGPKQPDFFDFYLGGLIGMKAYPFYAVSGNEIGWVNLTYRFPLFRNIDTRIGHLYLDKIFFSVYGDIGNAFTGKVPALKEFKKGAGAEIRIQMTSFYIFPTSVFFNASYGFDQFTREARGKKVTYGKEVRLYGGVLFGFDF